MRRGLWIVGTTLVAAALVGGGWFAAGAFTSPEQWEAQAAPPEAEPVLADVTRGDLIDTQTLGASIAAAQEQTVVLGAVEGASRSIVTGSPLTGGMDIDMGTVVARVNDAPVFALSSPFPFYRDLGVGDTGADVRALQENLHALGLLGVPDGSFGPATAKAVAALFRSAGASAPARTDPLDSTAPIPETPVLSPYLPLSAAITVTSLPATITTVPAVGADLATTTTFGFASRSAVIRVAVTPDLADTLAPGAELRCTVGQDEPLPCTVSALTTEESTDTGATTGTPTTWADLAPHEGSIDISRAQERAAVLLPDILLAQDALLLPLVAVAQHDDDAGTVLRRTDDGFETVDVHIIATLDGQAAVTGDLEPGDRVRVD